MQKNRMEAFSDGVLAIIITIMVLELNIPQETTLDALIGIAPILLSYVLSFIYIAIYWNNHHHLLHTVRKVNGSILWANNHLLFWLSLIPFVTAWSGESHFQTLPVALYGLVLLLAAIAYYILTLAIISSHGEKSVLAYATGKKKKEKLSMVIYAVSIPLSILNPIASLILYALVAVMWLIPDSRIEKAIKECEISTDADHCK